MTEGFMIRLNMDKGQTQGGAGAMILFDDEERSYLGGL